MNLALGRAGRAPPLALRWDAASVTLRRVYDSALG